MKLPFIDLQGTLPPSEEIREFGLVFDERSQSLVSFNELLEMVPLDLGGTPDVSSYLGHGKPLVNQDPSIPEHIREGNLATLEDVVNHLYLSTVTPAQPLKALNLPYIHQVEFPPTTSGSTIHVYARTNPLGETEYIVYCPESDTEIISAALRSMNDMPTGALSLKAYHTDFLTVGQSSSLTSASPTETMKVKYSDMKHLAGCVLKKGGNILALASTVDTRHEGLSNLPNEILNIYCWGEPEFV